MALPETVNALVKIRLPFLKTSEDDTIELYKQEIFAMLATCTGKLTPDLEDETTYNLLQKGLTSDLVALMMLVWKSVAVSTASDSTAPLQQVATFLKAAKAGSAEADFDMVSKNNFNISADFQTLYESIRKAGKNRAAMLGCFNLTMLFDQVPQYTIIPPFVVYPSNECN